MNLVIKSLIPLLVLAATSANASLIQIANPDDALKMFSVETKVDQNINASGKGSQRGHDLFLREGEDFHGASINYNWMADYQYSHSFNWSLSLNDDLTTTFIFDGVELNHTSLDGNWNAFGIWFSYPGRDTMTKTNITVSITGQDFTLPIGENRGLLTFMNNDFSNFTSVSGTTSFNWEATENLTSPNGRMAVSFKALEVTSVPEPTTLAALCLGLFALGLRRRTKWR